MGIFTLWMADILPSDKRSTSKYWDYTFSTGAPNDNLREPAWSYLMRGCYDFLVVLVVMTLYKWEVLDAFWSIMLLGVLSWPEAAYLFLRRNGCFGLKAG